MNIRSPYWVTLRKDNDNEDKDNDITCFIRISRHFTQIQYKIALHKAHNKNEEEW